MADRLEIERRTLMEVKDDIQYDVRYLRILNEDLTYDVFRSEICHMYHFDGTYNFIRKVMKGNLIFELWNKGEYYKALYTLAMVDYIAWKNNVPPFDGYDELRQYKLEKTVYPSGIVMMDRLEKTDKNKRAAYEECKNDDCGRFFIRYNIIEKEIEDVV
jgi:hypothetical protein